MNLLKTMFNICNEKGCKESIHYIIIENNKKKRRVCFHHMHKITEDKRVTMEFDGSKHAKVHI